MNVKTKTNTKTIAVAAVVNNINGNTKTIAIATVIKNRAMRIQDVIEFTGYSRSYLYKLIRQGKISAYKPNNGRMYFKKEELETFLYRTKKYANYELEAKADSLLLEDRKRRIR